MKQGLSLRVSQHLALTPQLQQSIRLLQLSTLELSQEVEQMLGDNPFLEVTQEEAPREEFGLAQADAPAREPERDADASSDYSGPETDRSAPAEDTGPADAGPLCAGRPGASLTRLTAVTCRPAGLVAVRLEAPVTVRALRDPLALLRVDLLVAVGAEEVARLLSRLTGVRNHDSS